MLSNKELSEKNYYILVFISESFIEEEAFAKFKNKFF